MVPNQISNDYSETLFYSAAAKLNGIETVWLFTNTGAKLYAKNYSEHFFMCSCIVKKNAEIIFYKEKTALYQTVFINRTENVNIQ